MKNRNTSIVFGAILRELRKERGLTQETLAFDAELDRTYISLLELGQCGPSLDTMLVLARAMNISLAHLSDLFEKRLKESQDG